MQSKGGNARKVTTTLRVRFLLVGYTKCSVKHTPRVRVSKKPELRGLSAKQRIKALTLLTRARSYVPTLAVKLYKSEAGLYRVSYQVETRSLGMADLVLGTAAPFAPAFVNECGTGIPMFLAKMLEEKGIMVLRGNTMLSYKNPAMKPIKGTMADFGSLVGYMPSLWSAIAASGFFQNIRGWVHKSTNPDGTPTQADGSGFYILDKDRPNGITEYLESNPGQIRFWNPEIGNGEDPTGIFAKGLIVAIKPEHLPAHLRDAYQSTPDAEKPWFILCTEQFKAGGPVEVDPRNQKAYGLKARYPTSSAYVKAKAKACAEKGVPCVVKGSLGIMQAMPPAKGMKVSPQITVRCNVHALPIYWDIFTSNFQKWKEKGGVEAVIQKVLTTKDDPHLEMANYAKLAELLSLLPETKEVSEEEKKLQQRGLGAMSFASIRNIVYQQLGKQMFRMVTGLGLEALSGAALINAALPPGVVLLPKSWKRIKHGTKVLFGRYPIVGLRGVKVIEAWNLHDPECPEELRVKYAHLMYQNTITAHPAQIVVDTTGDDDGDRLFVIPDQRLVKAFEEHQFFNWSPDEAVFIEGYPKDSEMKARAFEKVIADLSQDFTGPVGVFTNLQDYFLSLGMTAHANACSALIQACVDRKKNIIPPIDIRGLLAPENWELSERHGAKVWIPKLWPLLNEKYRSLDDLHYEDVLVMMGWAAKEGGFERREATPWVTGLPNKKTLDWGLVTGDQYHLSLDPDHAFEKLCCRAELIKLRKESPPGEIRKGTCQKPGYTASALQPMWWNGMAELIAYFDQNKISSKRDATPDDIWKLVDSLSPVKVKRKSMAELDALRKAKDLGLTKIGIEASQPPPNVKGGAAKKAEKVNSAKSLARDRIEQLSLEELMNLFDALYAIDDKHQLSEEEESSNPEFNPPVSHLRAWQLLTLGNNALSRLMKIEVPEECSFVKNYEEDILSTLSSMTKALPAAYQAGGWGAAFLAMLKGEQWNEKCEPLHEHLTLAYLHRKEHGSKLQACKTCCENISYILVREYRNIKDDSVTGLLKKLVSTINAELKDPEIQKKLRDLDENGPPKRHFSQTTRLVNGFAAGWDLSKDLGYLPALELVPNGEGGRKLEPVRGNFYATTLAQPRPKKFVSRDPDFAARKAAEAKAKAEATLAALKAKDTIEQVVPEPAAQQTAEAVEAPPVKRKRTPKPKVEKAK